MKFYALLLKLYPAGFRRDFGQLLQLQFKDELKERNTKSNPFHLLGFWAFILGDLVKSLVTIYEEEVREMIKKPLSSYSGLAAIITAICWCGIWAGGNAAFIGRSEVVSLALFCVILLGGAVTLHGVVAVALGSHLSRVLSRLQILFATIVVLGNIYLIGGWTWLSQVPGHNVFEIVYWIFLFGYFIIAVIFGISVLTKEKWLLAISMFVIALPVLVNAVVNFFNAWWIITLFGVLSSAGWLLIGWWLKKEGSIPSQPGALETA